MLPGAKRNQKSDRRPSPPRARTPAEWLALAVVAALSVALLVQAAEISLRLWGLAAPLYSRPGPAAAAREARRSRVQLDTLVSAHLFGKVAEVTQDAPASAAETWVLSGTMRGDTPASGAAILGRNTQSTRFCAVGQEVSGGFRLAEVFADRVTIERGGVRLSLRLPRSLQGVAVAVAVAQTTPPVREQPAASEPKPIPRPANQPPALLALRPFIHRGENGFDGMRVTGAAGGQNLSAYGLQRNDVIREVDGFAINSPEAQRHALDMLSRGQELTVTVERDGNVFTTRLGFGETGT